MMHLDIPPEEFWTAIGVLLVALAGFAVWFIKWSTQVLTFDAHKKICVEQQNTTKEKLTELKDILEGQNRSSDEWRIGVGIDIKNLTTNVASITTKVAVLEERSTHPASQVNIGTTKG
jgi:hypothetical protein